MCKSETKIRALIEDCNNCLHGTIHEEGNCLDVIDDISEKRSNSHFFS